MAETENIKPEEKKQETSEELGIIDDIKKTINDIRTGVRENISSIWTGFKNLISKGFDKLFGTKEKEQAEEEPKKDEVKPTTETEDAKKVETSGSTSAKAPITKEEILKPSSEKLTTLKELAAKLNLTNETLSKQLEDAQKKLETATPDNKQLEESCIKISETIFKLIKDKHLSIKKGDITAEKTDAIVNAANTDLKLGEGVAGAIKEKGGEDIQKECDKLTENGTKKVEIGTVAITGGGKLSPKIIHAPVMNLGGQSSTESIKKAVIAIIKKASEENLKTISIPALGAGVGNVKPEDSAKAIKEALMETLSELSKIEKITFVLSDDTTLMPFNKEFDLKESAPKKEEKKAA